MTRYATPRCFTRILTMAARTAAVVSRSRSFPREPQPRLRLPTAAIIIFAMAMAQHSASATALTVSPLPDQRLDFAEDAGGSVVFIITNPNHDALTMTLANAFFTSPQIAGDGDDVASNAVIAQGQCPKLAGNGGTCQVTVTFSTSDPFTTASEVPDLVMSRWRLNLDVTAQSTTHTKQFYTGSGNLSVGVYDQNLPEPASLSLFTVGSLLIAAGCVRKRKRAPQ